MQIVMLRDADTAHLAVEYPTAERAKHRYREARDLLRQATGCHWLEPVRRGRLWVAEQVEECDDY